MTQTAPKELQALLPFYVNGTLSASEAAEVEAALLADPQLAQERDALTAMRAHMQADEDAPAPSQIGWARLSREIDQEQTQAQKMPANLSRAPRFQAGILAACAAAFGAAVVFFMPAQMGQPEPAYLPASASEETAEALLRVAFAPTATAEDINAALVGLQLDIVSGPSALGFYLVTPHDPSELAQIASALEGHIDVIQHVEVVSE